VFNLYHSIAFNSEQNRHISQQAIHNSPTFSHTDGHKRT